MSDMKREYIDLCADRAKLVENLEDARKKGDKEAFSDIKGKLDNLNGDIDALRYSMQEQERKLDDYAPTEAEARDAAEERGAKLMKGEGVTFSAKELRRGLMNSARVSNALTLATATLAEPTGVGEQLRDPVGSRVSSLIDQVFVQDLTGMSALHEPYVVSELTAVGAKVSSAAGTARTVSTDPVVKVAKIAPYEVSVTAYVDRNISRLTPVAYYEKVYGMALRAMRRKVCEMIVNGDGQTSPDMFGMANAKNTEGGAIYASIASLAMDASALDELFYAYGGDAAFGSGARLILTKSQLKTLGQLRNSLSERVFRIYPDASNPNIGVIDDGGTRHPYTLVSGDGTRLFYGDPMNYELGLFGDFTVRVDESIKGVERMHTILGDAMVGGNLIADKGVVVATLAEG